MGLSFGIALSLVIIAGAELFTGNAFVMYNGLRMKTVTVRDVVTLWVLCYLGNWFGAIVLSTVFYAALGPVGAVGNALAAAAATKMSLPPLVLLHGASCVISSSVLPYGAVSGRKMMQLSSSWYSGASMHSLHAALNIVLPI